MFYVKPLAGPTGRLSELPDYSNKLAECQFLGYKELGLIQDW